MSNLNNSKHKTIFFVGPPGAGKSTAAESVQDIYNLKHVSTGRILRAYDPNTHTGKIVQQYMSQREVPPAHITKNVLKEYFDNNNNNNNSNNSSCNGYILDGYPLNAEYVQILSELNIVPQMIFYFDLKDNVAINRQCLRNDRPSDNFESAAQRVKNFRNIIPKENNIYEVLKTDCDIVRINAEDSMQNVKARIINKLSTLFMEN